MTQNVPAGSVHQRAGGQDRERFDPVELASLAASIERDGCLSPPHVRDDGAGGWEIILGERRVRAMRDVLGWETIPVEIDTVDDETAARRMLVENVNRSDLDPIAEARAFRQQMEELVHQVEKCIDRGLSRDAAMAEVAYEDRIHIATGESPAYPDHLMELFMTKSIGVIYDHIVQRRAKSAAAKSEYSDILPGKSSANPSRV